MTEVPKTKNHLIDLTKTPKMESIVIDLTEAPENSMKKMTKVPKVEKKRGRPPKGQAPVIGIDLGTTYSCIGAWQNNCVEIIANEQGNKTTPSCVAFTDVERLIGEGAKNHAAMNPINTIFDCKRLIGRKFTDATVQADMKLWPFKIIAGPNDKPMIRVGYKKEEKQFSAEEISSMILIKMKEIAENYLCTPVTTAVISVPAYFNDLQRQATKDAATIAGLDVMRIINEPTAAALAYGLHKKANRNSEINALIFDLGGGTFDVSVITISGDGTFTVKASGGNSHLGGEDFDNRVVTHFIKEFKRKHKVDISENPKALGRLRLACERAKRMLSSNLVCPIEIDCLSNGIDYSTKLSRARFEELNMDMFKQCIEAVSTCLNDAKMEKKKVNEVVLVGGSTRIPRIRLMLQEFFERNDLNKSINPDEAVAYGATVHAAMLSGKGNKKIKDFRLVEVTPLSLGVEVVGDVMSVVIPKNTVIPTTKEENYTTVHDYQTTVSFKVYQGERAKATANDKLGEFLLTGIPPAPRRTPQLKCCFKMDANGILDVSAVDTQTGNSEKITIGHDRRKLSKKEIEKMIQDAEMYKFEDQEHKNKMEALHALENYIYVTRNRLYELDGIRINLLPQVIMEIGLALEAASQWLNANKNAQTKEFLDKKQHLEIVCSPVYAELYKRRRTT